MTKDLVTEVLVMCSECKSVKVGDRLWLSKETDSLLYSRLLKEYEGRISHGLCEEDAEKYKI